MLPIKLQTRELKFLHLITDQKSMKTKGVPFTNRVYSRRSQPSEETKRILSLAAEIESIKRATTYIVENWESPPKTPNYYMKKLNSF
jgi:hypothetical protein